MPRAACPNRRLTLRPATRGWLTALTALAVLATLVAWRPAQALDAERRVAQYHHTRWTAEQGAPLGIRRMVQTADGWLWLASTSGLYRFDGVSFERFAPAADPAFGQQRVADMVDAPNGDLWVSWYAGGVSRIDREGRITRHGPAEGLPAGRILSMRAEASGVLWAGSATALHRFDGQRWDRIDADRWRLPMQEFAGVHVDERGTVWVVADEDRLHYLLPGAKAFSASPIDIQGMLSFQTLDGAAWAAAETWLRRLPDVAPQAARVPMRRPSSSTLIDRDRNLWTVYCPAGLCRKRVPADLAAGSAALAAPVETVTQRDGLSGDIGMTILEDREGALWVATQTGLDRFRDNRLTRLPLPSSMTNFRLARAADGSVLVAARDARQVALWRVAPGRAEAQALPPPEPGISSLLATRAGPVYVAGIQALWRLEGGRSTRLEWPAGVPGTAVLALAEDPTEADGLWLLVDQLGLLHRRAGTWAKVAGAALPPTQPSAMASDGAGGLWLGYRDNQLLHHGAQPRAWGPAQGVAVGHVELVVAGRSLFIAGPLGVQVQVGDQFRHLGAPDDEALRRVTGIVEDEDGGVWLNGPRGAAHLAAAELQRLRADARHRPRLLWLDTADGYPSAASPLAHTSSALRGGDGRLWWAGLDGVAWLDPKAAPRPTPAPRVLVRDVRAGDQAWTLADTPTLPAGTDRVVLRYTALALSMPERVQFEVRLDGVDVDWRPMGTRREAQYTNLPPGEHRFRVRAATDRQAWPEAQAEARFTIAPRFVQTAWFKALCAAAVLALLAWAYRLRTQWICDRLNAQARERLNERERIARDLHDTLLQGVHGLTLSFQAVADGLPRGDPVRGRMETLLDRADALVVEGRDRVLGLRIGGSVEGDGVATFRRLAADLAGDPTLQPGPNVSVTASGGAQALAADVADEAFQIGREALLNAWRHAQARTVAVELHFGRRAFRLVVQDDGTGIDARWAAQGRPGHWGVLGMQERAQRVGGRLGVGPGPGLRGTRVALEVPARRAYARR